MNNFLFSRVTRQTSQDAMKQTELEGIIKNIIKHPKGANYTVVLADKYIQQMSEDPLLFTLPQEHECFQPLLTMYKKDTQGFLDFILTLRDTFSKNDKDWSDLQKTYRRINGRHVQKQRRERATRACSKAEELYGSTDYHSRLQWVSDLEHEWAGRRLEFMDAHRSKYKTDRLDTEVRAEVLAEFWDIIDTEIYEGRSIPPWN